MADSPPDILAIFTEAVARESAEEREKFLNAACENDARVRQRVDTLLRAHFDAGKFLAGNSIAETLTVPQPLAEKSGAQIGPYKLLQQIGEGGMGTVFMAEQTHPVQRKVALKVIKPGMDSRQVIARFEAERQALALMDHPNIAKVLDAGTTDSGQPYVVMELVHGVPITKFCDEHRLTPRQRLELFVPVCQAIQHAHQKGIIHRDVKPSNVLIAQYDGKPVPKVIDFGVAKATGSKLTNSTMFTEFGSIVGTLEYMSPEQADRNQLDIDTRSDIYSLGVLLYELLTGSTPLDKQHLRGAAILELLRIIKEDEPQKPSTRLSTTDELPSIAANRNFEPKKLSGLVRGELDWIVMKALEKDRNRRYETANGFAMDVQRYLADEPVQACPPSALYRFSKFARRNKAAFMTAALIAVALFTGTVISTWQAIRATTAEGLAATHLTAETTARQEETKQRTLAEGRRIEAEEQRSAAQRQSKIALQNEQLAKAQELLARRRLYAAQINLVDQALERGEVGRALAMLEAQRPQTKREDLRGFEWYCLWRLCHEGHLFTLRGHEDRVSSVAFSPDGSTLASSSWDGTIKLWDPATGQVRGTLPGHSKQVTSVVFSPDGKTLASGSYDGTIQLWEPGIGRQRAHWQGHLGAIRSVAFSPDGKALASASSDRTVKLWDSATGNEKAVLRGLLVDGSYSQLGGFNSVAFSPDGKTVAAGGEDWNNLRLWDAATGQQRFVLKGHVIAVYSVAFSPDGKTLATGANDMTVKLWDAISGQLRTTLHGHTQAILSLSFSPDSETLATGTRDGTVTLWNLATQQKQRNLRGHRNAVSSVAISPDGRTLASASSDRTVKLWDLATTQAQPNMPGGVGISWALAFSPDSKELAISYDSVDDTDDSVKLWDVGAAQEQASLERETDKAGGILGLAFSPDGRTMALGGNLKLLDLPSRREKVALKGHKAAIWSVAFAPDGKRLVSGGQDNQIKLWDVATGQERNTFHGHTRDVTYVNFSPDGTTLASASKDQTVKLWDVASGQERATLRGHAGEVWSLAFTPDGNTLISAGGDVKVWDVNTGTERLTLKGDTSSGRATYLTLSPDGKTLATAERLEGLTFWDTTSWHERATFKWHWATIRAIAFSPDGIMLATAGEDGSAKLWRAATEEEVRAQSSRVDLTKR